MDEHADTTSRREPAPAAPTALLEPGTTEPVRSRADAPGSGGGDRPHRLRELRRGDLALALGALALVLVPFVVALVRSYRDGWVPSGDEANIATRALAVFSAHPPLTGLPSTSGHYGREVFTYHPGPFEFYLLAAPIRVLGERTGPLLTAATINASMVLLALWALFRRAGLGVLLWGAVLAQAVMWSGGTSVLVDTLSSNMTFYPVLGTALLAWAVADGDYRLLPLAAIVASYAAQQHLAAGFLVGAIVAFAFVALLLAAFGRRRRGEPMVPRPQRPWSYGAIGALVVCWLPVLVDEVKGRPGNLTAIVQFARDDQRQTLGFSSAFDQITHAIVPPTVLARTDRVGWWFVGPVGAGRAIATILIVAALVVTAVAARRTRRSLSLLAMITLVLLAGALISGSNIPVSYEVSRVNLYRWAWTAAFLTWTTLGWAGAVLVRDRVARVRDASPAVRRFAPAALLVLAALVALATVTVRGRDDRNREANGFRAARQVSDIAVATVDRDRPVLVRTSGHAAGDIGANVIFRLIEAGFDVRLLRGDAVFLGRHRQVAVDAPMTTLYLRSGDKPLPRQPGRPLTEVTFDPAMSALLDDVVRPLRTSPPVVARNYNALVDRYYKGGHAFLDPLFALLRTKPRTAFRDDRLVDLVLKGALQSPAIDRAALERLLDRLPHRSTVLGDEKMQVVLMTPAEAREAK